METAAPRRVRVHYVIFAAKIWNVDRDAEGWRPGDAHIAGFTAAVRKN